MCQEPAFKLVASQLLVALVSLIQSSWNPYLPYFPPFSAFQRLGPLATFLLDLFDFIISHNAANILSKHSTQRDIPIIIALPARMLRKRYLTKWVGLADDDEADPGKVRENKQKIDKYNDEVDNYSSKVKESRWYLDRSCLVISGVHHSIDKYRFILRWMAPYLYFCLKPGIVSHLTISVELELLRKIEVGVYPDEPLAGVQIDYSNDKSIEDGLQSLQQI